MRYSQNKIKIKIFSELVTYVMIFSLTISKSRSGLYHKPELLNESYFHSKLRPKVVVSLVILYVYNCYFWETEVLRTI